MVSDIESVIKDGGMRSDETTSSPMKELWGEVKEWRKFWDRHRFVQVLFLGLAASLFDSLTDFNFAQSVETDCNTIDRWLNSTTTPFDRSFVSSPCGLMYYKTVERLDALIVMALHICRVMLSRDTKHR